MSDLAGGGPVPISSGNTRPQNGGSRTTSGPAQSSSTGVKTPRDIMRERENRNRKRAESEARQREQEDDELRRAQESKRRSAERRPAAAGVAENPANTQRGYRRQEDSSTNVRSSDEQAQSPETGQNRQGSNAPRVKPPAQPSTDVPAGSRTQVPQPAQRAVIGNYTVPSQPTRPRGSSLSQPQPRPVPNQTPRATSAGNSTQQQPSQTRLPSRATGTNQAQAAPSAIPSTAAQPQAGQTSGSQRRNPNVSSFPHAFERWETLSSQWEGLTSYWIRRLEQNSDDNQPINQQLARQVTDLSAAGANLFHAVVELQRLRASSERKFQRWFFETRQEQERAQERQAELEKALQAERQARDEAASGASRMESEKVSADRIKENADQMVREMRRELQISKKEARRAWEELGRREQEERDRTASLKTGEPTMVGGVQVVPMMQGGSSRQPSTNRPSTREGPYGGEGVGSGSTTLGRRDEAAESPMEGDPGYTTYDPTRSETDTDPFTEGSREVSRQPLHHEPDISSLPVGTSPARPQTSSSSAAAAQAARAATSHYSSSPTRPPEAPTAPANVGGTYLSYGPTESTTEPPNSNSFYQHHGIALHGDDQSRPRTTEPDDRSYVPSVEDTLSEEEYAYDENGEVRRDAHGNPIIYRRGLGSEDSDEYNVQEQLERERMYGQRYGSGVSGVEYGRGPTATAGGAPRPGGEGYGASSNGGVQRGYGAQAGEPDYSGSGYGSGPGWEAVPRHHHPTRLSDVLEEDERSRTSPSRASLGSRGVH